MPQVCGLEAEMMEVQRFVVSETSFCADDLLDAKTQVILSEARNNGTVIECECRRPGIPMVLRRYGGRFFLARWPDTGVLHHHECPSYDPGSNSSAIHELDDGTINIRTNFDFSSAVGRHHDGTGGEAHQPTVQHERLSISDVLHQLWRQAGFDRWFPGMLGRRNWGVVKHHLEQASSAIRICGHLLSDALVSINPYHQDAKEKLDQQLVLLRSAASEFGSALVLAPLKRVSTSRFGFRYEFYHMPGVSFFSKSDHGLIERLAQLPEKHRLIALAIVDARGKYFRIHDIGTMPVNGHWLPYDDQDDAMALDKLVSLNFRFLVRHGHLRKGKEVAVQLGGLQDGQLIFPDPGSVKSIAFTFPH